MDKTMIWIWIILKQFQLCSSVTTIKIYQKYEKMARNFYNYNCEIHIVLKIMFNKHLSLTQKWVQKKGIT